ncbi:MAG: ATP-binding protein [Betaproteobacteria bacterium]
MSGASTTTMFPAALSALRAIRGFVERFCAQAGVGRDPCLRLNLVLEELFTNTIRHGYRDGNDAPVWISLSRAAGGLRIVYEDGAPPFNPYVWLAAATSSGPQPLRRPGGLGILLTRELAASREYAYVFGRNSIRLGMRLD